MTQTVAVPLWLLILILLFAAVTFASHFLFPSVRWFFRKRAERVIARLNARLQRPIEPFKLARRHDMIQRLIYDPVVSQAIVDHAREENVPENVAFELARRHAREIVPSFSATAYFTVGTRLAKWLSRSLYRIRLDDYDAGGFSSFDGRATVIFVMNHRSNMDYVLVTYLVSRASALAYAVGEWARVWPLSTVIRSMGAYFIQRRSRGQLYRRILARYVQLATRGGVTQAFFPEGGLSLDGRMAKPKLGLLSYVVEDYDPEGPDVVFVPVALNYDRVLEDHILIRAAQSGNRRFRAPPRQIAVAVLKHLRDRLLFRFKGFGTATVSFGDPLSLANFDNGDASPRVEAVAAELMGRIAANVPVVPVPLVARAVLDGARGDDLLEHVEAQLKRLERIGAPMPRRDPYTLLADGRGILRQRKLIDEGDAPAGAAEPLLEFYAASLEHHFVAEDALRLAQQHALAEES